MHFFSSTLTSDQVITALNGAVKPGMFQAVHAGMTTVNLVGTELDGVAPSVERSFTAGNWLGAALGEPQIAPCIIITLKTTQRGRRHTGRVFLGSITEDDTVGGSLLAATQTIMQAAWTTFVADATGAGIPLHVTSYGYTRKPGDPDDGRVDFAPSTAPVVTATVQTILGTQRRRQSRLRG
jgi:hypothetical protein